jgi:hypothetical protein
MVLDRGSSLVGELALRQAETSSRSVVAETRLPAGEPGQRWRRSGRHERLCGNTAAKVALANVTSGYRTTGHGPDTDRPQDTWRRMQAEEGSDIGQG